MTSTEVLRAARAKVAKGWTKGAISRNASGFNIWSGSKDAVCWCAIGAINARGEILADMPIRADRVAARGAHVCPRAMARDVAEDLMQRGARGRAEQVLALHVATDERGAA